MNRQFESEYQALTILGDEEEENADEQDAPPVDNLMTQIRPDQNRCRPATSFV